MATLVPPPSKRQKRAAESSRLEEVENQRIPESLGSIRVQFINSASGQSTGAPVSIPLAQANVKNLELLLNTIQRQNEENKENVPYRFTFHPITTSNHVQPLDIENTLYHTLLAPNAPQNLDVSTESLITLHYTPLSIFRVRAVSRLSATIPGHTSAILTTQFSPHTSARMVSGGGDGTARIWDCETGTPITTLRGHQSWVLAAAWSPDGKWIATGSYDNTVRVWDAATGQKFEPQKGKSQNGQVLLEKEQETLDIPVPLRGHTKWITSLAWEPYHVQDATRPRLASSSKDGTVRIWDVIGAKTDMTLSRHTGGVTCVKWGGLAKSGYIYTTSLDKTVRIWDAQDGRLLYTLNTHVHRVNHLALSSDFVIRTGYFEPGSRIENDKEELPASKQKRRDALKRFEDACRVSGEIVERFATASDDNKILLWSWGKSGAEPGAPKSIRLDGHQKQVNHVTFSPDGQFLASCGFDNHVILWQASTGKFIKKLIGHVAPVYQCCFSADSRLLVTASKDTTIKAWDVRTGKLVQDLPGHKDEVFAVDWSPDGLKVGSGGKDKMVKIWAH